MTDFRKLFKREMFEGYMRDDIQAEKAQAILNEALNKATVVYGVVKGPEDEYHWSPNKINNYDTHKALLIQVEEIKVCEHKRVTYSVDSTINFKGYYCADCKKQLIPIAFKAV